MIKRQLVRCIQCRALALFSPLDQSPDYEKDQGEWKVLARDDQASFLRAHRGHQLEELHVIEESLISHQSYLEPVKASYFEATDGKQCFVVKKFRENVFAPQRYELIPGKLRVTPTQLRIDGIAIQKDLEREFAPLKLSSEKIHHFVQQLEETVTHLNPADLRRAPFESHNPSVWYFYLDEGVLGEVLDKSSGFLSKRIVKRLDEFVRKNLKDGLFMAVAKVEFQIETDPEDKKAEIDRRALL